MNDTLQEAWEKACMKWREGNEIINRAQKEFQAAGAIPVEKGKISIWMMASNLCVDAMSERVRGYKTRLEGDHLWYQAVLKEKGDLSVSWENQGKDLLACRVNGDTFEP